MVSIRPHGARTFVLLAALLLSTVLAEPGRATVALTRNVVDLIDLSQDIVVGRVVDLHDDLDEHGIPFTEIAIEVDEVLRGPQESTLTFRQFGLLQPRPGEDGRLNLRVTPDGWPRFSVGEDVLLFLYQPAARTGFRTTVGLTQGKFSLTEQGFVNELGNQGLFRGTEIDEELQSFLEQTNSPSLRRKPSALLDFVRRAVRERWIEQGKLRHAQP